MRRIIWIFLLFVFSCELLQAASFDCTMADTKVERLICENPEISRLDEEMAAAYAAALSDQVKVKATMTMQKMWLEVRNDCEDATCLKAAYLARIRELRLSPEEVRAISRSEPDRENKYVLIMSKDDELCNHMLNLFNEDLAKYGWDGDSHQEDHEEFQLVPWKPARFTSVVNGRVEYRDVEGALFDFNNDGIQDFVVRWKSTISELRADILYILDADKSRQTTDLKVADLRESKGRISLSTWAYHLAPPYTQLLGVRVLEPFIYRGVSYLVMRPLFEESRSRSNYAVIAKYGSGRFVNRDLTGKMEDICYFRRDRSQVDNKQNE